MLLALFVHFLSWQTPQDSIKTQELANVSVQVFEKKRTKLQSPESFEAIPLANTQQPTFVSILNTLAGVRMEERSPGSYRIAIRGSALRAPFGVRNVKVYWNNIPFTDAGNNTYLALIEPELMDNLVLTKGPNGGLYGAGTGGSLLFSSPDLRGKKYTFQQHVNSLGGYKQVIDLHQNGHRLFTSFWQQKGYRDQSDIKKQFIAYEYDHGFSTNGNIHLSAYYGDVAYQTPGGLTLKQFRANPKAARPAAGIFLSAADQQATFKLKSYGLAFQIANQWHPQWSYSIGNAIQVNDVENPSIRNYEFRHEPNVSSRAVIHHKRNRLDLDVGLEFQAGQFYSQTFGNRKGKKDTLQTTQNTTLQTLSAFVQADYKLDSHWNLLVSGSLNRFWTQYIGNELIPSPRIALNRTIGAHQSLSAKISHGYSPPSIAEIRPSTGIINTTLRAEMGWNKEISYRGKYAKFEWDIALYRFDLMETIVVRRGADGADFFTNVGQTTQEGIEASYTWRPTPNIAITNTETIQNFKFNSTGKVLTGTSPYQHTSILQIQVLKHVAWNTRFFFTDAMYLNDANTDVLPASRVWNTQLNYQQKHWELWLRADNLGNEIYSSGPDLNAAVGRYYNAAPGRNFTLGLKIVLN